MELDKGIATEIVPFRFNHEILKWVRSGDAVHDLGHDMDVPKSVRLATHNVLKDGGWWMEWVIRSPERFLKEMKVLEEINADIIGLNEVTGPFFEVAARTAMGEEELFFE